MSPGDRVPHDEQSGEEDDAIIEALRDAWRTLPPPSPDRPLEDEDPATRRTVHWLRDAWLALPVPAANAPRAEPSTHPRWRRIAAAAALLLALGVPVLVALARRSANLPSTGNPISPITALTPADPGAPAAPSATVVAVDAHHLELRSGPVRLYLLTDPLPPHDEVPR